MQITNAPYKPVHYSPEVLQLQERIRQTQEALDALPLERAEVQTSLARAVQQEDRCDQVAGAGGAVMLAGLVGCAFSPQSWWVVGAGALGAISGLAAAGLAQDRKEALESRQFLLALRSGQLQDDLDFLGAWESDRRHSEWHEVNGYP